MATNDGINTSSDFNSDFSSSPVTTTVVNPLVSSTIASNDQKFDSDGCETIDKIAQMVSNITKSPIAVMPSPMPPQSMTTSSALNDVENQLKEMFSEVNKAVSNPPVIIEINDDDDEVVTMPPTVAPVATATKPKKPSKKKANDGGKKKPAKKSTDAKGKGKNDKSLKSKASDKKDKGELKKVKSKENGKSRVKNDVAPFLQIQKDGSFQIVNQTANGDDDAEKASSKPKKLPNEKHKNIRGLHVSTLSNKYDADKRDTTWVCVFCKLEPHKFKLGDLFGPYIISKTSPEYSLCLEDPANDIFRQGNQNKFEPVSHPMLTSPSPSKKKRKSSVVSPVPSSPNVSSVPDVFNGMTKIDDNHFEIWFHEDCLVWAPGTYIIGSKVNGLEAAVWQSTRHQCCSCSKNGAMMACLFRGCKKEAHFVCARKSWKLCDDFKTFCEQHSPITHEINK